MEVSIVIPCLNEAGTIGQCIEKAKRALSGNSLSGEIIVADNGSIDGSQDIAKRCGAEVIHVTERGYGAALMGGIAAAQGKYIIMGDGDDTYDFSEITPFIEKLRGGYDLVIGCRFSKGGGKIMPGAMPWKNRWIGNPVLSSIGRLFFKSPVLDFHCGLRAFTREAYNEMNIHTTGMEFASEMIIKATLKEMNIAEVPITLHANEKLRKPHLRPWRDGWRHLRFMLLYSPRWLFLVPGIMFFLSGFIFGTILVFRPIKLGAVIFDTNTMLVCSMFLLIGFQLVIFAIFTKIFAISVGLLPHDPKIDKIFNIIRMEHGVLVGLILTIIGFGFICFALWYWKIHDFGIQSYPDSLRITIPGVTISTLGIEIIFASFFLSILGLRRK